MKLVDILPPVLTKTLKAARDKARGPLTHFDFEGHRLQHRGTLADLGVIHQVFWDRAYDLARFKRWADIERIYDSLPAPLIVDAGANIGASTVWFAKAFPRAKVTGIEPHEGNFELMRANTEGLNVRLVHGALASASGHIALTDPGEGEWGFRTGAADGQKIGVVPAYTLSDVLEGDPFILKIDIEGGEADLFTEEAYARFPVLIIELHDWLLPGEGTSRNFLDWAARQKRDFCHVGENIFSFK